MRWSARRTFVGAAVLLLGMGFLAVRTQPAAVAADVSADELKMLISHDAKFIQTALAGGKPDKKAINTIKSSAMMIAAYAQDAKLITVRNDALALAAAMAKRDYKTAAGLADKLSAAGAKPDPAMKKVTLAGMHKFDLNELMSQFRPGDRGGLNVEKDIKEGAKKGLPAQQAYAIANRVQVIADYTDQMLPEDLGGAKKTKPNWLRFNKDMRSAATDLAAAAKANNAAKIKSALDKLDRSCVACHDVFRE